MSSDTQVRLGHRPQSQELCGFSQSQPRAELPVALPAPQPGVKAAAEDPLGEPLTIREVARLLGCSVWTVRHRCFPQGLPYFRVAHTGKLMFYRNQVTQWVLARQQERR